MFILAQIQRMPFIKARMYRDWIHFIHPEGTIHQGRVGIEIGSTSFIQRVSFIKAGME